MFSVRSHQDILPSSTLQIWSLLAPVHKPTGDITEGLHSVSACNWPQHLMCTYSISGCGHTYFWCGAVFNGFGPFVPFKRNLTAGAHHGVLDNSVSFCGNTLGLSLSCFNMTPCAKLQLHKKTCISQFGGKNLTSGPFSTFRMNWREALRLFESHNLALASTSLLNTPAAGYLTAQVDSRQAPTCFGVLPIRTSLT